MSKTADDPSGAAPGRSHVTLVQITDCHLCRDPSGTLLGVPTLETLLRVLQEVGDCHPEADVLVASGDIADDGDTASYGHFLDLVEELSIPTLVMPGNHDDRDAMRRRLASTPLSINGCTTVGGWLITALDTLVPGVHHGQLGESELRRLRDTLDAHSDQPTLIFLHHPPMPIGCPWLDRMGLRQSERLFEIIDGRKQVRGLVTGHVHQEFDAYRGHVRLLSTPATCVQYKHGTPQPVLDPVAPGYRVFTLRPNGEFATRVRRVARAWFPATSDIAGSNPNVAPRIPDDGEGIGW